MSRIVAMPNLASGLGDVLLLYTFSDMQRLACLTRLPGCLRP